MRQHLIKPIFCSLLLLLSFNTLAKASKDFISVTAKTVETTLNKQDVVIQKTTLNSASNSLAASTPLVQETFTSISTILDATLFNQGFFYGFLVMVILVNLFSYFLFNEKAFGYYGLALAAFALLFFNADNLLSLLIVDVSALNNSLSTTLVCIAMGLMALFSAEYLSTKDHFPKLKAFTLPLFICAASMALLTWFMDNALFAVAANVLSFVLIGIYFGSGILIFNKKGYAKFYVITSCIPLIFALDFFLLDGLGISFLNTGTVHIKTAFFVEMLVMTYAIIYRMRAIKEENIIRKTEVQLYLKRQESLSRESISQMIEDVYLENLIMQYDLDGVEIKLLQYISEGKENVKIARKLNTTEDEVEDITKDLYRKLEISEAVKDDYTMLESQPDYLYN